MNKKPIIIRTLVTTLLLSFVWTLLTVATAQAQQNPIVIENQQPGTSSWKMSQAANDTDMQIKGFASLTSVNQGGQIDFYVHVNPAQSFEINVYRMGWYAGQGGRLMQSIGPLTGIRQPTPVLDSATGMVTAPWSSSYTLQIPNSWTSGVYLAKLTNANGYSNYIIFIVRDDNNSADFLYQHAITTSQAYNNFPDNGVLGKSLYSYNSVDGNTVVGNRRAVKVSFDRPYNGDGDGLFLKWEYYMVQWMEKEGYHVTYTTNIDQHNNGGDLINYKGFISSGHDEYWTKEIFDAVENARDAGVHLAFTGANVSYWQSRLENNDRVLVVYKHRNVDPEPNDALKTIKFRDLGRAEQTIVGIQYRSYNDSSSNNTSYVVENSDHWIYEDSGFSNGSTVSRIVGYEIDNIHTEYPGPPDDGTQQVILSNSPFLNHLGEINNADSSIYQAGSGAWVFAAGTMSWSWGLQRTGYRNVGIQQAMKNVFERFLSDGAQLNRIPTLSNPGGQSDPVGGSVILQLNANDDDNDTLTYSADNLPLGLDIDSVTGEISGQLAASTTRNVTINTDDGNGGTASQSFIWIVTGSTSPIIIQADRLTIGSNDTTLYPVMVLPGDSNQTIGTISLDLTYDDSVISATGCSMADFTGACNTSVPGIISVAAVSAAGAQNDALLLEITVQAIGSGGTSSEFAINVDSVNNFAGNPITNYEVQSGGVAIASTASPVIIQMEQATVAQNETATIPVRMLIGDSNQTIGAGTFNISYDDSVILVTSCNISGVTGACNTSTSGIITLSVAEAAGIQNDMILAEMTVQAIGSPNDNSDFIITVGSLNNILGDSVTNYQIQNGGITILDAENVLGDVNCDNLVTAVDALYIMQYVVSLRSDVGGCPLGNVATDIHASSGDVNLSNTTDAVDSLAIMQCTVGIINAFCDTDIAAADQFNVAEAAGSATLAILSDRDSRLVQLSTTDATVAAGTLEIAYNSNQTQLVDCTLPTSGFCNEIRSGIIRISFIDLEGITDSQIVASLTFDSDEAEIFGIEVTNLTDSALREVAYDIATTEVQNHTQNESRYRLLIPFVNHLQ